MLFILLALLLPTVFASPEEDAARLGAYYTNIAIFRTGSGNNVVTVGLGDPEQTLNLTISTNVDFVLAVSDECDGCVQSADRYTPGDSRTITPSQRALSASVIYPTSDGSIDTILLNGNLVTERLTDPRQDSYDRVIGVINEVEEMTNVGESGRKGTLPDGVSGFFGLGVYQESKQWSLMPSLVQVNGRGAPSGSTSYVVGFDMAPISRDLGVQAGNMHFGGVPVGAYTGNFNWMDSNRTVAGSWGVTVDRMRVVDNVIGTERYYGSLDPGFDAIYVPEALAEDIFSRVPDAQRDGTDTGRWNVPCDADISMTVTISGRDYKVDSSQLVQQRGVSPNSCWSTIVAWQSGSLPDTRGEIRLGTPFLAGVYAVLYHSDKQQLVGLAGKPGTVNDANLYRDDRAGANGKLAGILIGSLLAALIVLLLLCYGRNRNSFQSIWYRGIRRQHRAQVNALVKAATIPPPMIGGPLVVAPPMMGMGMGGPMMGGMGGPMMGGMGGMGGMGPMVPMGPSYLPVPQGHMGHAGIGMGPGMGGGMGMGMGGHGQGQGQAPPMYQPPMQPQQQPTQHHHQHQLSHDQGPLPYNAQPPHTIEHTPKGTYSGRHHSLPLPAHGMGRSPKPPRYSQPSHQMQVHLEQGQDMGQIPNNGPPVSQQLYAQNSMRRSDSQKVHFSGPHNDRGPAGAGDNASLGLAQGWNQGPYPGQSSGQRIQDQHQNGSGPSHPHQHQQPKHHHEDTGQEEPSMVQRDRIKVEEERAMLEARPQHPYSYPHKDPNQYQDRNPNQRLHQPQRSPTQSEKKRWWRNSRNHHVDPRYTAVPQMQDTGTGTLGRPHTGGTGEAKSFFSDRGWNKWSRQEKEQDRRASRMGMGGGGGGGGGQWYA